MALTIAIHAVLREQWLMVAIWGVLAGASYGSYRVVKKESDDTD